MAERLPQKVRLMTPEGASEDLYLYPVTGLNAITVGTTTTGDAYRTYIAPNGKILAQYLDIMTTTPTAIAEPALEYKVDNNRLDMIISGSTIKESYLPFIVDGKISTDYLPGYVDDVVEVPIKRGENYPSGATLLISASVAAAGTTYWFYKKVGNEWQYGGGESGKLYVGEGETDGAIYRAVNTSSAAKISETPYVIDETATNGVHLTKLNNTLSAVASLAGTGGPGTIQIDSACTSRGITSPVWFNLSGGVLSVSAGLAATNMAGAVFAVGTDADYNTLISAGHGAAYIVPTVAWTKQMITSGIIGVGQASYSEYGIVKIQEGGGILVTSGVLSVPSADGDTRGLTYLLDTFNTDAAGDNGKAVTKGAVISYITSNVVPDLQPKLTDGNGINIDSNNKISVDTAGDGLVFQATTSKLMLDSATATTLGGVMITGDPSVISAGSGSYDGKPLAANPAAISGFVASAIEEYSSTGARKITSGTGINISSGASADEISVNYDSPISAYNGAITVQKAGQDTLGVVKVDSASTGVTVDANGVVKAVLDTSMMNIDASNQIYVSSASVDSRGAVKIVSTGAQASNTESYSGHVPTVSAMQAYLSGAYQKSLSSGTGITITDGATVSVNYGSPIVADGSAITVQKAALGSLGVVKTASEYTGIGVDSNGVISAIIDTNIMAYDANNKLTVSSATISSGGVVQVVNTGAQAADPDTYSSYVPTVSALNEFVTSQISAGAVTVTEGSGIQVTSSAVNSGMNYAVSARVKSPIVFSGTSIGIQTAAASIDGSLATTALGAVYVYGLGIRSDFTSVTSTANTVPTESAVRTALNALPYITYEKVTTL